MSPGFLERLGRSSSTTTSKQLFPPAPSSKLIVVREMRASTSLPTLSGHSSSLDWSLALSELAVDVSNMLQFTPAAAAAALLTAVLKTTVAVKINQERCMRIGERAARSLASLGLQMEGKWESAPQSLLDNLYALERTLSGLQECMRRISQANWRKRLLSKPQIEDTLQQCEARLDEALQAFQFTSLIQIHYIVGKQDRATSSDPAIVSASAVELTPSRQEDEMGKFLAKLKEPEDEFGYRRYHASDVLISKTRSRRIGWFSEISEASANGNKVIVKAYTGPREETLKQWYQDIKRLRNIYHGCFPQLLGYSGGTTTPFILLSNAPKQDVISYLQAWWTPQLKLADGTRAILEAYQDIAAAMLYVQQQLSLDNQQAKEFIRNATYGVDHNCSLVLGLPAHVDDDAVARRWTAVVGEATLRRTIFYHYLRFLEKASSSITTRNTVRESILECICLINELVLYNSSAVLLPEEVQQALDSGDVLALPKLRTLAYARADGRSIFQSTISVYPFAYNDFSLGDVGIGSFGIPGAFVNAGNILELEAADSLSLEYTERCFQRQPDTTYPASDAWMSRGELQFALDTLNDNETAHVHSVSLMPIHSAWLLFLKWARPLAEKIGVEPQDLRMVIRLGGPQPIAAREHELADNRFSDEFAEDIWRSSSMTAVALFEVGFLRIEAEDLA
ncbi:hypothetical protein FA95DRAFT_1553479 [Auriscalpium vulgare]|uniref:Uncharacterized protein n=1 Tax=Auriscalpium vulgare TaxID=40419 RepID=A0ACB8S7H4_9AGAM|nr:hypothetical protein FA95DRAFT_1553479 [Auriscalpium vulgare]